MMIESCNCHFYTEVFSASIHYHSLELLRAVRSSLERLYQRSTALRRKAIVVSRMLLSAMQFTHLLWTHIIVKRYFFPPRVAGRVVGPNTSIAISSNAGLSRIGIGFNLALSAFLIGRKRWQCSQLRTLSAVCLLIRGQKNTLKTFFRQRDVPTWPQSWSSYMICFQ